MSSQLTFRQKTVRIAASAAICGLSISFLVGEAVDQKAKLLNKWVEDPALIPAQYLPTRPLEVTFQQFDSNVVSAQWLALNAKLPESPVDLRTIRSEFVDVMKITRAAPAKATAATETALPAAAKRLPTPVAVKQVLITAAQAQPALDRNVAKDEVDTREVEGLLLQIHNTTAKLSQAGIQTSSAATKTDQVAPKVPNDPPSAPVQATKETGPKEPHSPTYMPPVKVTSVPKGKDLTIENGQMVGNSWLIKGKITNTSLLKQPGHFEVGLYSAIDSEGVPLGFPLAQEILPNGKVDFQMSVPGKVAKGYLFAEFVGGKGVKRFWIAPSVNPWLRGELQFAELAIHEEDTISTAAAAPSNFNTIMAAAENQDLWMLRGSVDTLFAKAGTKIMQPDVVVKVRGRREATRTDKDGKFSLELPRIAGTVYLELLKPGYHPTILPVTAGETAEVSAQLASREAVDRLANLLGTHQNVSKGVFIGKATGSDGKGLRGMTAQMSLRADGPFYFGEQGFPNSEKKQTTSDGRFIFFNVEPGAGYMETNLNGESIVPFQLSSVEGGELTMKTLVPTGGTLRGRIFNPVASGKSLQPLAGARVRLEGSADWSTTDSFGAFSIPAGKWIKGERAALEFSAEKFNNHRYTIDPDHRRDNLNLFAFPANYIRRLAQSMDVDLDPYAGIVFGKVSSQPLRLDALADHSPVNGAKDFYFDGRGRLKGSHSMTDPKFGTYVIFNVPKGNSLLQGSDSNGKLRYSDSVIVGPSSVTVVLD